MSTGRQVAVELGARLAGPLAAADRRFRDALGDASTVAVAFSGGVDSSVTVALAARHLGTPAVTAILGVSPSLARVERAQAGATARAIGVRLVEVRTHEIADPDYVANRGDRCYFCKHELYTRSFADAVETARGDLFCNGDTADDRLSADRPGGRAAAELGVRSPLAEAGIGKAAVRDLARALGLPVWDKPSAPCLASRVVVDLPVTVETLGRIERAEESLRAIGMRELRVRHLGPRARVELGRPELDALDETSRAAVLKVVGEVGYGDVEIAATPLRRG